MERLLLLAILSAFGGTSAALRAEELAPRPPAPELRVPMAAEAPVIDGALNDPVWSRAAAIEGFVPAQGDTTEMAAEVAARPTSVRLLWDKDFLYIALTARDDAIYTTGTLGRDDPLYTEDAFEIFLDPVGDGRMMIETQINPHNQIFDLLLLLTGEPVADANGVLLWEMRKRDRWNVPEWNWPTLRHGTSPLVEDGKVVGWTAELALPAKPLLKRLGLKKFEPLTLRANIIRLDWLPREGEEKRLMVQSNWSPVKRGHAHIAPATMGTLILEGPAPKQP